MTEQLHSVTIAITAVINVEAESLSEAIDTADRVARSVREHEPNGVYTNILLASITDAVTVR